MADLDHDWMQDELRAHLGLRPDTRLDNVILQDGTTYELQGDGTLQQIR